VAATRVSAGRGSTTATEKPASASPTARVMPTMPPPAMATSKARVSLIPASYAARPCLPIPNRRKTKREQ